MRPAPLALSTLVATFLLACGSTGRAPAQRAEESLLTRDQIPSLVSEAALHAVPGLRIEGAEVEGGGVLSVLGTVDGLRVEVEVDADGRVLEIERGEEEDDDPDDGPDAGDDDEAGDDR